MLAGGEGRGRSDFPGRVPPVLLVLQCERDLACHCQAPGGVTKSEVGSPVRSEYTRASPGTAHGVICSQAQHQRTMSSARSGGSRELAIHQAAGGDISGGAALKLSLTHDWLDHAVGPVYTTKEAENREAVKQWLNALDRGALERVRWLAAHFCARGGVRGEGGGGCGGWARGRRGGGGGIGGAPAPSFCCGPAPPWHFYAHRPFCGARLPAHAAPAARARARRSPPLPCAPAPTTTHHPRT